MQGHVKKKNSWDAEGLSKTDTTSRKKKSYTFLWMWLSAKLGTCQEIPYTIYPIKFMSDIYTYMRTFHFTMRQIFIGSKKHTWMIWVVWLQYHSISRLEVGHTTFDGHIHSDILVLDASLLHVSRPRHREKSCVARTTWHPLRLRNPPVGWSLMWCSRSMASIRYFWSSMHFDPDYSKFSNLKLKQRQFLERYARIRWV